MRLRGLADHLKEQPVVRIRYFVPDERINGGAIVEFHSIVQKIANGIIVFADNINIPIEDIVEISVDHIQEN